MESDSYSSRVPQFEMGYPQYSLVFFVLVLQLQRDSRAAPRNVKPLRKYHACTTFPPRNPTYFHMQWMDMYGYVG